MKRPVGFTLLSLFLFFLGVAAIGNLFVGFKTLDLKILIAAYCLTAFVAALGLYLFREWAYRAYISWSIIVMLLTLDLQFGAAGVFHLPTIAFIPWIMFVILFLSLLARYIKSRVSSKAVTS